MFVTNANVQEPLYALKGRFSNRLPCAKTSMAKNNHKVSAVLPTLSIKLNIPTTQAQSMQS